LQNIEEILKIINFTRIIIFLGICKSTLMLRHKIALNYDQLASFNFNLLLKSVIIANFIQIINFADSI